MTIKRRAGASVAFAIMLFVSTCFTMPFRAFADDEKTPIGDATNLYSALYFGGKYKLTADINTGDSQYGSSLYTMADTVLDLDGHTITLPGGESSVYTYGGNLVIEGGEGKIVKSVQNTEYPTVWAYLGDVTLNSGNIEGQKYPMMVSEGAHFTMNGGTITGATYGVNGYSTAEITINGGTITATEIGVLGRGTDTGTKITITGGTINSSDTGVYAPQLDGVTTISGGTINAPNGVEVRAGSLSVTGGTINVPAGTEYSVNANGSGTTTLGSAISIVQHTTRNPITVDISNGTFTAPVAVSQADPQDGDPVDITVSISGGTYDATEDAVKSSDLTSFITGGSFNLEPNSALIAEGYGVGLGDDDRWQVVNLEDLDKSGHEIDTDSDRILPKQVDWSRDGGFIETNSTIEGQLPVTLEIKDELIADRKSSLSATEVNPETLTLDESKGGELIGAAEISLLDRNQEVKRIDNNRLIVWFDIDEDTYNALSKFSKLYGVYFENGVEVERYDATLETEGVWFETTHLSTYGIVGVNDDASSDSTSGASTPDTGTVTMAGASATTAAMVTAFVIGILTAAISFSYLYRRLCQTEE